jgi:hypothetical protein
MIYKTISLILVYLLSTGFNKPPTTNISLHLFDHYRQNVFQKKQKIYVKKLKLNDLNFPSTKFVFDIEPFSFPFYSFSMLGQIEFINTELSYHKENTYLSTFIGIANRVYLPIYKKNEIIVKNDLLLGVFKSGLSGLALRYGVSVAIKLYFNQWFSFYTGYELTFELAKTTISEERKDLIKIDHNFDKPSLYNQTRSFFIGVSSSLF